MTLLLSKCLNRLHSRVQPCLEDHLARQSNRSSGVVVTERVENEIFQVIVHMYKRMEKEENLKCPRNCAILSFEDHSGAALGYELQLATAFEESYGQTLLQERWQ